MGCNDDGPCIFLPSNLVVEKRPRIVWPTALILFLLFPLEPLSLMVSFSRNTVKKNATRHKANFALTHVLLDSCSRFKRTPYPIQSHISSMSVLVLVNPGMSFQHSDPSKLLASPGTAPPSPRGREGTTLSSK